jgi:hypothetical protein
MPIALILPTMTVLRDGRVTAAELDWYARELILIAVSAAVMGALWQVLRETTE